MRTFLLRLSLFAMCVSIACGGGTPTSPTGTSVQPASTIPSGAVKVVTSMETGQPIPYAHFTINSTEMTADDRGQVTIDGTAAAGMPVAITASGFLSRETLSSANAFTLWVNRDGFDADFLLQVGYGGGAANYHPDGKSYLRLSAELGANAVVADGIRRAVDQMNAEVGDTAFEVNDAPPSSGVVFDVLLDSSIASSGEARVSLVGSRVIAGSIRFKSMALAGFAPLITHELGHAAGLNGHNPGVGLMTATIPPGVTQFTWAEKLALKIRTRPSGVAFVDNDRRALSGQSAMSAGAPSELTIRCAQ